MVESTAMVELRARVGEERRAAGCLGQSLERRGRAGRMAASRATATTTTIEITIGIVTEEAHVPGDKQHNTHQSTSPPGRPLSARHMRHGGSLNRSVVGSSSPPVSRQGIIATALYDNAIELAIQPPD